MLAVRAIRHASFPQTDGDDDTDDQRGRLALKVFEFCTRLMGEEECAGATLLAGEADY